MSDAQWERLTALATSLTAEQSNWVGGYFTGYAAAARGAAIVPPGAPEPPPPPAPAASRTLTVLYASETGNGIELAEAAAAHAATLGLTAKAVDVADYKPSQLKDEQDLLVVASTHGEGEPPQPALGFFEFLAGRKAPRLDDVRFAVMALGDSTYEHFCEAGKILDRRFEELGAARLEPRIDCDVDQLKAGRTWGLALLDRLAAEAVPAAGTPVAAAPAAVVAPAPAAHGEDNPFLAEVLENTVITGRGSSKETRHLELRLDGSGISYEPGDALGIVGRNDSRVIEELLGVLQLAGDTPAIVDGTPRALAEALERDFEIMAATPRFLTHWADLTGAADLQALTASDKAAERTAWLKANHVVDILRQFPVAGLEAESFLSGLRRLQPRFYSIASSQAAQDGDVHLTVSTVRYDLHGTERRGVVSGSLGAVEEGATLPVFVRPNPHFRLPADDVPIIMIGAGTGVAPYRAFVQEREQRGATGRSWLIFGDRNFRSDFLYQAEWQAHQKPGGALSLIDVVFSRDGTRKQYVQDRVRERATEIFTWLQEGAHLYVCGDADGMAPGVHQALLDAVASAGQLNADAANDYVRGLQRDGRYQRDVY